jgi:hypothetical protein
MMSNWVTQALLSVPRLRSVHVRDLLNRHSPDYFLICLSELFQVHVLCSAEVKNGCEPEDLEGRGPYMIQGVISAFSYRK